MFIRIIIAIAVYTALAFIMMIVKPFYDVFTDPTTGLMIGQVDDTVLAIATFIPWFIWFIAGLTGLFYIIREPSPEMPSYPTFRQPQQQRRAKQRPPMI